MYPFIYTPPEIIAREVKKEFSQPKVGNGTVQSRKLKTRFSLIWLGVMTSPIWGTLAFLLFCKMFFGA